MSPVIRRGLLSVAGRRVHYRWAGDGPPVVMLHGSPGDSEMFTAEITAFARDYTAIAFDTPGFGLSEPLPEEGISVTALAGATAAAMAALGLPPCRVYGSHTGAAIGLELGVGWPEQVSGLLLEGVPLFTTAEMADLFTGYFAPMIADPLGGHLTSTWIRFRDQHTWFPWLSRDVRRLNKLDRPTPAEIDHWVSMFYRSCRNYAPAYRAACFYRDGQRAAAALRRPAIHVAAATDMLHPHMARLPERPEQSRATLPDGQERAAALLAHLRALPGGPGVIRHPVGPVGSDPALCIAPGNVFVRCYGTPDNLALLLAHDSPGTGLACQDLARALAERFYVVVPDLPGCGETQLPSDESPILEAAADALRTVAVHLELRRYTLLGFGCGAAVAAILASQGDPNLAAVLLRDLPRPDPATAAAIAPDIALSAEGAHWIQAWLMLRDGQIYRPWFAGTVATQRRDQGNFDADFLHDQTCALLRQRAHYHRLPRAAWQFETTASLRAAKVPVHLLDEASSTADVAALVTPQPSPVVPTSALP